MFQLAVCVLINYYFLLNYRTLIFARYRKLNNICEKLPIQKAKILIFKIFEFDTLKNNSKGNLIYTYSN